MAMREKQMQSYPQVQGQAAVFQGQQPVGHMAMSQSQALGASMQMQHQQLPPLPAQGAGGLAQSQQAPSAAQQQQAVDRNLLNRHTVVNKRAYARLDLIGKGGSSRVYRVLSSTNELHAIKRVSLDRTDADTMNGYMNEIALLKRLEGNQRIIRLIDSEVKPGTGGSKGYLLLVMECGEVDLAKLIQEQSREAVNMVWVAYYWQQMLQAVHVIHEEKIVHSDLKPANFVLVKGQLKLIDFGIANAIANDTTNIQRDHQIGTVNYMSPEAIELPDGMRRLKVGRPSDVWSLGVILYQMVYGQTPFQHLSVYQKMKAIPDEGHEIEFPEYSVPLASGSKSGSPNNGSGGSGGSAPGSGGASASGGGRDSHGASSPMRLEHLKRRVRPDVIRSMKSCLCRNPKDRATIPELLKMEWLGLSADDAVEAPSTKPPPAPDSGGPVDIQSLLAENETVINPHYMRQLLEYGMKLAQAHRDGPGLGDEGLDREAVRLVNELKGLQKARS